MLQSRREKSYGQSHAFLFFSSTVWVYVHVATSTSTPKHCAILSLYLLLLRSLLFQCPPSAALRTSGRFSVGPASEQCYSSSPGTLRSCGLLELFGCFEAPGYFARCFSSLSPTCSAWLPVRACRTCWGSSSSSWSAAVRLWCVFFVSCPWRKLVPYLGRHFGFSPPLANHVTLLSPAYPAPHR